MEQKEIISSRVTEPVALTRKKASFVRVDLAIILGAVATGLLLAPILIALIGS